MQQLMSSSRQKGHDIPIFVEKALVFLSQPQGTQNNSLTEREKIEVRGNSHNVTAALEAEGLFRLSGQQTAIDSVKELLDSGKVGTLTIRFFFFLFFSSHLLIIPLLALLIFHPSGRGLFCKHGRSHGYWPPQALVQRAARAGIHVGAV